MPFRVLLDPLKEQFHLPATLVNLRDGKCGQHKVVRQEFQSLLGFLIEVTDATQCIGIVCCRFERCEDDGLILAHASTLVHWMRVASLEKYIRFGAHDKESRAEYEDEESLKIDI